MDVLDFISSERLAKYEEHTDNRKKAVALHNHTLQLGSSLMAMIALMELALRNSTNHRLISYFGDANWLLPNHTSVPLREAELKAARAAFQHAQRAAYSKLSYKQKSDLDSRAFPNGKPDGISHKKTVEKRQSLFDVSHGQVISQTTLFFWKRLYSSPYQDDLWRASLKLVFPNKGLKRSDVSTSLETIYATRNRVAHHEPVYGKRLEDVMDAIDFIRESLGAHRGQSDSSFKKFSRVHHLRLRLDYESFVEAWHTLT